MRALLILLIATISLSLTSCQRIKEWSKNRRTVVERHYHDSTFTIEKETIRDRWLPRDSTTAHFDLEELKRLGFMTNTDRYFTTEIRYVDNGLKVTTTLDSLMERIRTLEKTTGEIHVNTDKKEAIKESTKEVTVTSYWWILIVLATIIGLFLLKKAWNKFKAWNLLGLK